MINIRIFHRTIKKSIGYILGQIQPIIYMHLSTYYRIKKRRSSSISLSCFTIAITDTDTFEVLYNGVKFWTKRDDDSFEFFLMKIRKSGGMKNFEKRATEYFNIIDAETLDFMRRNGMGFDFYKSTGQMMPKNADFVNTTGETIARLIPEELPEFIKYFKLDLDEKSERLNDVIIEAGENSTKVFDPKATEDIFGIKVPASEPPNGNGLAPDYRNLPEVLYAGNPENATIKIKMTGCRNLDEKLANFVADLDSTPDGYVWHHLDDLNFDPESGIPTCTMQLVRIDVHKKVILQSLKGQIQSLDDILIAGEHLGGAGLWARFFNIKYK